MSKTIVETRPSVFVKPPTANTAITIGLPYNQDSRVIDISVPLRKPRKKSPARLDLEELAENKYRKKADSISPQKDVLRNLAERHSAPQDWYDEDGSDE